MDTRLHIGAHKTATTHLQACLEQNCEALAARGIGIFTPVDAKGVLREATAALRADLYTRHPHRRDPLASIRLKRRFRSLQRWHPTLVLSDENIIEWMANLFSGRFYPDAGKRISKLIRNTGIRPVSVFLSVREYGSFFSSAYAFQTGRTVLPNPEKAARVCQEMQRGWPELVSDVLSALPGVPLKVWRHEAYDTEARLEELTGCSRLAVGGADVNQAPTPEAMAILRELRNRGPLAPAQLRYVRDAFTGGGRFTLWPESEAEAWRDLYRKDLDRIADMPGVELEGDKVISPAPS